jgi:hypothetical protein
MAAVCIASDFGLWTLDLGRKRCPTKRILVSLAVALVLTPCVVLHADPPRRSRTPAANQAALPPGSSDIWQVIYLGKGRMGYSHTFSRPVKIDGKALVKTDSETHLTIKRFGRTL